MFTKYFWYESTFSNDHPVIPEELYERNAHKAYRFILSQTNNSVLNLTEEEQKEYRVKYLESELAEKYFHYETMAKSNIKSEKVESWSRTYKEQNEVDLQNELEAILTGYLQGLGLIANEQTDAVRWI